MEHAENCVHKIQHSGCSRTVLQVGTHLFELSNAQCSIALLTFQAGSWEEDASGLRHEQTCNYDVIIM